MQNPLRNLEFSAELPGGRIRRIRTDTGIKRSRIFIPERFYMSEKRRRNAFRARTNTTRV